MRTPAEIVEEVRTLATEQTDGQMAETLNARWLRSGTGKPFTRLIIIRDLRGAYGIESYGQHLRGRGWLTAPAVAAQIGVHVNTAKGFASEGLLRARGLTTGESCCLNLLWDRYPKRSPVSGSRILADMLNLLCTDQKEVQL